MLFRSLQSRNRRSWLIGTALMLLTAASSASSTGDVGYTLPQVYSAALRYLRIDLGYPVTEKDPDAAYLLFKYRAADKKTSFGAFELVATGGRVRVVVKLPDMPSYHETVLRDGLLKKLREDYGVDEPARAPKRDEQQPQDSPERPKPAKKRPPKQNASELEP